MPGISETITARTFSKNIGNTLTKAIKAPLAITNHGRPIVVLISVEEFENLQRDADVVRVARALANQNQGEETTGS